MKIKKIMQSEEDIKQKIIKEYFSKYDISLGKIDLTMSEKDTMHLGAEAKPTPHDIYKMFAQLFLTVNNEMKKVGCYLSSLF